ncbi:hypothetical protein [Streptomyces sp.]|uniref:hypothetical protein n=1 Tax=Streptomyces sp. TaxID=1931 RepID=UPI002D765BC7|nr:hypothetical protein [Streptomyces sp.]HET6353456.1 hypothetical protein [Streptomyces sp.]
MAGTEAASKFEVLALGGFEGPPQGLDFSAVPPLELGELGGEGAHDAAGRGVGRRRDRPGRMVCCWARSCSTRWRISVHR